MFGGAYFGEGYFGGEPFVSSGTSATFTTVAGGESADGGSTSFTGDGGFATNVSADTASGGSTTFNANGSFVGTTGGESADGGSTALTGNATFSTTASADNAAGGSTTLTGDGSFSTNVSADTASGGSTTFDTAGNASFDTLAGGESAAGGSTSFSGTATFSTNVSTDTASGGSTTLTGNGGFSTVASGDTAGGGSTTFDATSGAPPAAWIGNAINALSGSSVSCTLPNWTAGKTGVIVVATEAATNGNTCSTPTGYTYATDFISNSSSRMYLFYKSMTDGDSGATVTAAWSATNRIAIAAVVVENATFDTFATTGAGSGTSISIPTLTAGGADGMEVVFFGGRTDAGDTTTYVSAYPSGFSNTQSIGTTATGTSRNVILGSGTLAFSSATLAATTATTSASINSRAGVSVSLLGAAVNVNATFSTVVGTGSADGGSTTMVGNSANGTFSTVVGAGTADGGNTSFSTVRLDATFGGGATTLKYPRPDFSSYTVYNVPAAGEIKTLPSNTTDYLLVFPNAPVTGALQYTGGRNIAIVGGWLGGRKTQPALTDAYDAPNRGIRFYDGADVRTIWIEGLYVEGSDDGYAPTYLSDTIQIAQRSTNGVTVYIQNVRMAGINWGNNTTTPNVHADVIQCWGGPTNMFVDGVTAKHLTYQGFYWNPADGRALPTGTHQPWEVSRVNLEGDNLTGFGVRYLLYNVQPTFMALVCDNIYTNGSSRNVTDTTGKWPSTGLTQNATPPSGDFVPFSLWDPATYSYVGDSAGVTGSVATAAGGSTSFTTAAITTFSTIAGTALAEGDLSTFSGSTSGGTATFTTLTGVGLGDGGLGGFIAISPQDAAFFGIVSSATASGGSTTMFGTATTGTFFFTPPVLLNRQPIASDIGYTVIKNGTAYSIKMSPSDEDTLNADFVYVGGHVYEISPDERNALVAAGYSVSSTPL